MGTFVNFMMLWLTLEFVLSYEWYHNKWLELTVMSLWVNHYHAHTLQLIEHNEVWDPFTNMN